jgi:potassium/sodium efflux P-type ATPase
VFAALSGAPQGLSQVEAEARLRRFGRNSIRKIKRKPLILKLLANFTHMMAILLWIGGIVAFAARMPELGAAVWCVNFLNGAFSFWQEYKAEKATEMLRQLLPHRARVLRDGREQEIFAEELVPGDLLLLSEGDHISADGRLVQDAELYADQSVLTGEAHPVRKTSEAVFLTNLTYAELPNLVFAGTHVVSGTGRAVVFATGMASEFGKIAHLTQSVGDALSPLQREMKVVTKVVSAVAVVIGAVCFVLSTFMARMDLAEGFIFALGMIVAFVPEGLLPTVTLALAVGVQRMAKRHALVKRLSAVETLGCTTVICTDKTGTLTQNEMTVCAVWLPGRSLTVTGVGYTPEGRMLEAGRPLPLPVDGDLRQLFVAAALCNDARLLPPNGEEVRWTALGDPTEAALLVAAGKGGIDTDTETKRAPRLWELPFESRRKRMSTGHRPAGPDEPGGGVVVYTKGAPGEVLKRCAAVRMNGQTAPLDEPRRGEVLAAVDAYAADGLRVLAVSMRRLPGPDRGSGAPGGQEYTVESVEQELTFLGLIAMMDPPRPEVAEAAGKCHRAGIRTMMITGDYGLTAETIARRIGLIRTAHPHICTGADLDAMDDGALKTLVNDEVIFARVAPEHKLRIVRVLQEMGHVVAVTGDGVNDAPALKKADIGVAMGVSGTDVAKEAADIVLTDDNFASIVNAVEEGRAVYANVKKFTSYIFTSNTPEAVPFILFALSGARIPLALTIMQILSVDLGTDMIPALALGAEPPEPGVMHRPPRSLKEHVITWPMLLRAYPWLGAIQSAAAMAAFYFQYWTHGYRGQWLDLPAEGALYASATAMTLAAIVTTQIGNLFAQRTERSSVFQIGFFSNRLIWAGIATELILILMIVYIPVFHRIFGTASFAWTNWLFLFAWTPALFVADEIRKALVRRFARHTT